MTKRSHSKKRSRNSASQDRIESGGMGKILLVVQALVIVAAGWWIYLPALHAPWFTDDTFYFTNNSLLQDPLRLFKAWTEPGSFIEYYPITESVQWVEARLFGSDTFGYHLVNVISHLINALLVWRLFRKFGLKLAWLGGLLFAIHPLQVESVVWISELKNTLSLTFLLFAMEALIDYDKNRRINQYWMALIYFGWALLCKVAVAPFPLVILLYAWWKRGRIAVSDARASAPFFIIALLLIPVSVWSGEHFQATHHVPPDDVSLTGVLPHLALVGLCSAFYLAHSFLPLNPLPCYPLWSLDFQYGLILLPWVLWILVGLALWKKRQTWGRHAILGLGFFFITLAPVLGFTNISYMHSTWVMDHFHYVPMIGLFGLFVAALEDIGTKVARPLRNVGIGILGAIMGLLMVESHAYSALFADPLKLWSYTIEHNPGSWTAHYNLAVNLLNLPGRQMEAVPEYETVIRLKPDMWAAYDDWGSILLETDRPLEAKEKFAQTLRLRPDDEEAHFNLGLTLEKLEQDPEAISEYREAIKNRPDFAEAHYNLAHLLFESGQISEALAEIEEAARLKPENLSYQCSLANVLSTCNRTPEAIAQYRQVIAMEPGNADAHNNLGKALLQMKQTAAAKEQFEQAVNLRPDFAEAHFNLGILLLEAKDVTGAIQQFRAALAANPNLTKAHVKLGDALTLNGEKAEADEQYNEALQISPMSPAVTDFLKQVNQQLQQKIHK